MKNLSKNGFTLIELMIVVAIVAIIAAIGYPSYQSSVQKSKRADAKIALNNAASLQEKYYFKNNVYASNAEINEVGGVSSAEGNYNISVDQPCGDSSCFRIIAAATASQAGDTDCSFFTISNTGVTESYSDSVDGTSTTATCW